MFQVIDERLKDEILRYPTERLVEQLVPGFHTGGRKVMRSPFRDERHPSFSCFSASNGISRWKDHTTGESGDNISLYRRLHGECGYAEALDSLSQIILGRSVYCDMESVARPVSPAARPVRPAEEQTKGALEIVRILPASSPDVPHEIVSYWRGRAISDETAHRYCSYVVFENLNRKGRMMVDPLTRLPLYGPDGNVLLDSGVNESVALPNDVGGWSLRTPDHGGEKGFKGTDRAFLSTILADGTRPAPAVGLHGSGDRFVSCLRYEEPTHRLYISPSQFFSGVQPYAAPFSIHFLEDFSGRYLMDRDVRNVTAVLRMLSGPINSNVCVVEGMFDALSVIEMQRLRGRGTLPGGDLVVLNSVNNLKWAVPFLSMHRVVSSLLDNDLRSSAGQNTYQKMRTDVAGFAEAVGSPLPQVRSESGLFHPYKDVNDFLMKSRGFVVERPSVGVDEKKKASVAVKPRQKFNHKSL